MAENERAACDVCGGTGDYPVINMHGTEVYSIRCPECFGSGTAYEEPEPESDPDMPPPSTAAKIKTMDELREWMSREGSR